MIPFAAVPGALVTVDPGKRRCGVAVWLDGVLVWAARVAGPPTPSGLAARVVAVVTAHGGGGAVWVIEDQQNYPGHDGRKGDLDSLRRVVAQLCRRVESVDLVRPAKWKGNVPKTVHHARCAQVLSDAERRRHATDVDTLDAVALGLWALRRTGRGGTRPDQPG